MGDWMPSAGVVHGARRGRRGRRGSVAAVSVLPRVAARRAAAGPRRSRATGSSNGSGTASALSSSAANGETWLWSRGEELITRRFPEIAAAASHLPDGTVLDGEVLAFADGRPMPFSALQQRIGRQKQVAQVMRAVPVVFVAYDVLERDGVDMRQRADERASRRPASAHHAEACCARPRRSTAPGVGRARGAARRIARARRRRVHPQAPRLGVRRRAPQGRVVEVEDRSADGRRRAHLRAAGQRPAREPADRLHLRRLGPGHSSSRWRRRTRDCRTPRSRSSTNGSGVTRASATGPCARSSRSRSSSLASKRSRRRPGTRAGSPCASHGCSGGEKTSRRPKPTRWIRLKKAGREPLSTLLATGPCRD